MVLPRCGFVPGRPVDKDDVLGLRLTIAGVLYLDPSTE